MDPQIVRLARVFKAMADGADEAEKADDPDTDPYVRGINVGIAIAWRSAYNTIAVELADYVRG